MTSNNDDIQIELGQSQRRHIEHKINPLESSTLCAIAYDQPASDQIPIFIAEATMRAIERHTLGTKDREVGGILLGDFYRNGAGSFIEISDFVEAKSTRETDVSLTFTHDTWEQINAEMATRVDNARIVGWYHSHPGLGVFMSREDEFIHEGFFNDAWQVAIVVDPIYHNWGCFKWIDGKLERTKGFYVYGSKKSAKNIKKYVDEIAQNRKAAPRAASASADRRQTVNAKPSFWLWAVTAILATTFVYREVTSRDYLIPGEGPAIRGSVELKTDPILSGLWHSALQYAGAGQPDWTERLSFGDDKKTVLGSTEEQSK